MEIEVKVNCTPEELRTFLGWPDVGPLQREMLERVSQMMRDGVSGADPMSLMRMFMAPNTQGLEAMFTPDSDATSSAVTCPDAASSVSQTLRR